MATKIPTVTKQLAHQKIRDGLTAKEVADLTGISVRTAERMKAQLGGKSALPARTAVPTTPPTSMTPPTTQIRQHETSTLDFEDSPDPVEHKGAVDTAMSALKGMLGIDDKHKKETKPPLSGKLTEKQQNFVDSFSPMLALGFVTMATWIWGRIGPDYKHLAPDDEVSSQIVTPLLRIYARHAAFVESLNPDVTDIGASMFALIGYVNVSLGVYQEIKREKEEYEQGGSQNSNISGIRGYRDSSEPEDGASNTGRGYADVRRAGREHDSVNGRNDGRTLGVSVPHLSDKEARQHAALSRLGELDYQSRARRSGRA